MPNNHYTCQSLPNVFFPHGKSKKHLHRVSIRPLLPRQVPRLAAVGTPRPAPHPTTPATPDEDRRALTCTSTAVEICTGYMSCSDMYVLPLLNSECSATNHIVIRSNGKGHTSSETLKRKVQ